MNDLSQKRYIALKGEENENKIMSNNITLMKHAIDYAQQKDKDV